MKLLFFFSFFVLDHIEARRGGWTSGSEGSKLWEEEKLQIWHCSCQLYRRSIRQV